MLSVVCLNGHIFFGEHWSCLPSAFHWTFVRRLLQVLKCSKADPGEEPMDTDMDIKSSDLWSFPVRLLLTHLQYPRVCRIHKDR